MLNRLSVNTLLKSAITAMAVVIVVMIAARAWDSWQRLSATSRIAKVAESSRHAFKAMNNLRTDRSSTVREINSETLTTPDVAAYLRGVRDGEVPALHAAADLAETIDFADHQTLVPALQE